MNQSLHIASVISNKYAISQEDAQQIFPSLEDAVTQQQSIDLSFDGIENCSSIFLNNLLGKLYLAYGEKVDLYIHFTGIDKDDRVLPTQLERLRKRALNPQVYKPIFDNALGQA